MCEKFATFHRHQLNVPRNRSACRPPDGRMEGADWLAAVVAAAEAEAEADVFRQRNVHYVAVLLSIRRAGYQPGRGAAGVRPRPWIPSTGRLLGAQRQVQSEIVRYVSPIGLQGLDDYNRFID